MLVTVGILVLLLALAFAHVQLMGRVAELDYDMQRQLTTLRKDIADLRACDETPRRVAPPVVQEVGGVHRTAHEPTTK
jgi:hypothetical protein